jgi:hypothetical protein
MPRPIGFPKPAAFRRGWQWRKRGRVGDWIEVIRSLVEGGDSREEVRISGKPQSEEVIDHLLGHGITPDNEPRSNNQTAR